MNWIYGKHHRIAKAIFIVTLIALHVMLVVLPPDVAAAVAKGKANNTAPDKTNNGKGSVDKGKDKTLPPKNKHSTPPPESSPPQSTNYKIITNTISEGGNTRSSATYKISQDMIGNVVGRFQSVSYKLASGFVYTSANYNQAPVLNPVGNKSVSENTLLEFLVTATDQDGDSLSLSASNLPTGATFVDNGDNTGTFSWTPTFDQSGNYPGVHFEVTDGQEIDSEDITITVGNINRPPELAPIGNKSVNENELLEFIVTANDPDGDSLSFNALNLPSGATFIDNGDDTATFSWTPTYVQSGNYPNITIEVSDTSLTDSETIQITVFNVNRPPYFISPIPDLGVNEGDTAVIDPAPHVADPDGETLYFYYTAPFDSQGKWITTYDDAGIYTVTVTISDLVDTIQQDVQVTVHNVNRAPTATLTLSTYTVNKFETFTVHLVASDPDGDAMTFVIERDGIEISSGSIVDIYDMNTSIDTAGDHTITATVTDSGGLQASDFKTIDVIDPNQSRSDFYPVLGDFNGDAVTDLGLHNNQTGIWEIALSDDGTFTSMPDWLTGFGTSKDWLTIGGDFDGDGYNDIGIYNNITGECRIATSTGSSFSVRGTWLTFSSANYDWQPLTGDFNGDGKTDFGIYNKKNGTLKVALSTGTSFGSLNNWITSFGGSDELALAGDFNSDALADVVIYNESTGNWRVALSTGAQFQDKASWLSGYAANKKILVSDFNSDGLVDIGYFEKASGNWYYAISNGASFIDKGLFHGGFGSSAVETGHTGDFNGDGILDLATFGQDMDGIERWNVLLRTAQASDLLIRADNGVGGVTTITYDYASKQDNALLPFPVYVVKSVTITDNKPQAEPAESYTQNFSYKGGYYSAQDREFRGFQIATATDPITNNYTETYFHQGRDGEEGALKGQIDKIIAYDGNAKKISEVLNTYEVKKGGPLDNNLGFPCIKEIHTKVYEENLSLVETIDRFTYDNLGNAVQTINEGDIAITQDNKITNTIYSRAYTAFNRVLQSQLLDKDLNILMQKNFEYDDRGNLISQRDYLDTDDDPVTTFGYDSFGNLISTTNANGYTVLTDYETTFYQFPETITNVLGHTIAYTYEPKFGLVKTITDANGNITTTNYDALGRITEEINSYGQTVTSYSYPDFNTKITTQLTLTKTEYTDGLGRNYKTVTVGEQGALAKDVVTEKFFNIRGLLEAESLPHYIDAPANEIAYIRYTYDIRGRPIQTIADFPGTLKDATTVTQYLTPLSIKVIDPKGHAKTTIKDVHGNVIEVVEHTSGGDFHTYYEYDLKSNLVKVTDAQGNITQIFYDSLGRKTSMIDPDTGTTQYTYDAMGNILTQTDNKGQTITFIYDDINRLAMKDYDSPVMSDVVYTYDALDPPNSTGRLSSVDDGISQTSYEYDKEGRVVKVTRVIDGQTYITQTSYDILGRITSITYPDNEVVNYTYDSNSGLLEKVYSVDGGPLTVDYIKDITYNAQGQILTIQYGNNTQTDYTYNLDQRLQRILTQNQTASIQDLNYDFDKAGNLSTLTDNLRSNIRTYQYDDLNRLMRAENIPSPLGGYATFTYQYDAIGNMIYKSDVGAYAYGEGNAGPHAVTTAGTYTYTYDDNGNMIRGRGKDLIYDAENRLIEADNLGQVTTFEYNHNGARIKKVTADQTVTYISKLYEVTTSPSHQVTRKHIFAGPNRICTVDRGPSTVDYYYYHSDHLGSSNVITDETGSQVQYLEYQPYGKTSRDEGTYDSPYKFTGKELDDTSGLYYYGARYYDPEIGRFITADSFVQDPLDPQTLNRYTYCRNNPLIYTDPSGNFFFFAAIIGAIIGAIAAAVTGGNIVKGAILGAVGGALTAGISGVLGTALNVTTTFGKAAVSAVAAFASASAMGAVQGIRGSDLLRTAAISAGVAFAATMVVGGINDAAKNARTADNPQLAEAAQVKTAEGSLDGNTAKIEAGSKAAVSQGAEPAGKGVTGIVNEGGGSNVLAGASQTEKTAAVLATDVASNTSSNAATGGEPWYVSAYKIIENVKVIVKGLIEVISGSPAIRPRSPQPFLLPKKVLEKQIQLYEADPI